MNVVSKTLLHRVLSREFFVFSKQIKKVKQIKLADHQNQCPKLKSKKINEYFSIGLFFSILFFPRQKSENKHADFRLKRLSQVEI
jgi:hypothetical protein